MELELDEQSFIERYNKESYASLADHVTKLLINRESTAERFKNNLPASGVMVLASGSSKSNDPYNFIYIEASIEQTKDSPESYRFRFQNLVLLTEECPDYVLDRINEFKKATPDLKIDTEYKIK